MKNKILANLMIFIGVLIAVYVGGFLLTIDSIIYIINEFKSGNISIINIVVLYFKIILAGYIGVICGFVFIYPGKVLLEKSNRI